MLLSILELFKERKILSPKDISQHLKIDQKALEPMLHQLIESKKICYLSTECNSCSGICSGCSLTDQNYFYKIIQT